MCLVTSTGHVAYVLRIQSYLGLSGSEESKEESSGRPVQETEADFVCPLVRGTGVLSPSKGMLLYMRKLRVWVNQWKQACTQAMEPSFWW